MEFTQLFTSPLIRARETAALAGFPDAKIDPDLVEWNYGEYEGKTTKQIRADRPGWYLFQDGCPGGESPADVGRRADRVLLRLHGAEGNILLFSHGHFLRVLAARWVGLDASAGRFFDLDTAALSAVGYEHGDEDAVITLWNDCRHVTC
jgi:broad specificity phosphatase PhoE